MELFIKFINFINHKIELIFVFIGHHTPSVFLQNPFKGLINRINNPSQKKKTKVLFIKRSFNFIFSPSFLTIAIFISTTIFFHQQALRLGFERPEDDVVKEMNQLKKLRKPAFFKYQEREFVVDDIYFPIYIKSTNSIKRLILDLNLRASNRYIKTFFTENNSRNLKLIYDKLSVTIEEIVPDFPLTHEGKYIIKRKIKVELDILLRELSIKGDIEKVFISQIIGA